MLASQPPKLTQGCIEAIMKEEKPQPDGPTVQILNHKSVGSNSAQQRFRVIVSDGIHFNSFAMLATQMNDKITSGEIVENTIVRLDQFVVSKLPSGKGPEQAEKKVLVILNLTVLVHGSKVGMKIGNPVVYDESSDSTQSTPATNGRFDEPILNPVHHRMSDANSEAVGGFGVRPSYTPRTTNTNTSSYNGNQSSINLADPPNTLPIAAINPYQNRWVIKARVLTKTAIRSWSNSRGDGKLFSMDLHDESGGIRATCFTDVCDKFYEMIELNKVYYISKCQVKPANKKFTSLTHDFELTFNQETQVVEGPHDDRSIPELQFNFTPLNVLKDVAADTIVDIVGICQSCSNIQSLVARATKRELKKRDIVLVDQTNASVTVSLWDKQAEEFDDSTNPVIAIKNGRLTEFNGGKTISIGSSSVMRNNPDIPESHKLRGWYDGLGDSHQFSNISMRSGGDGGNAKIWTFKEVIMNNVGRDEKPDYLNIEATAMFIQPERALYNACPNKECKKKVLDQNDGTFRCEKCNQSFPNFVYRLMLNAQFCDWTFQHWVTMFQEQAEQFLGATAAEIGQAKEAYDGDYNSYFRRPLFKTYMLKIRAKVETFNNESRLRMAVVNFRPIDYKESSRRLLQEIKTLSGVSVASN